MPLVPTVVTMFSPEELAEALYKTHVAYFNSSPSDEMLASAWGHNVLECGRDAHGRIKSCRCFNLGNITVTDLSVPYWSIVCAEQQRDKMGKLNGVWVNTAMHFAAFDSLLEGATYYWAFISRRTRSFAAMKLGDGYQFGQALAADHYMTANIESYAKALRGTVHEGLDLVKTVDRSESPEIKDLATKLMNMIALTLDESIKEDAT